MFVTATGYKNAHHKSHSYIFHTLSQQTVSLDEPDPSLDNQIQIDLLHSGQSPPHALLLHPQPGVLLLQLLQLRHLGLFFGLLSNSVLAASEKVRNIISLVIPTDLLTFLACS